MSRPSPERIAAASRRALDVPRASIRTDAMPVTGPDRRAWAVAPTATSLDHGLGGQAEAASGAARPDMDARRLPEEVRCRHDLTCLAALAGGRRFWTTAALRAQAAAMTGGHEDVWDQEAAEGYDTPGTGMFAPAVLDPVVDRLAELASGGGALEFAIGTGRVAVPLRARGTPVSGIELSPYMVARLRAKADEAAIPVVVGDMTEAESPGDYALVFLVFNGISNLLTQGEQVRCFRNAARHLKPGGRFVVELWVPELPRPPPAAQAVAFEERPGRLGIDTYDVVAQHVVSHHVAFGAGIAAGREARVFRSPHRYAWPSELDLMGRLAGFELESRHADWSGTPFTAAARSHVSVYRLTG